MRLPNCVRNDSSVSDSTNLSTLFLAIHTESLR